jgi:type I restriction enzyme M protein
MLSPGRYISKYTPCVPFVNTKRDHVYDYVLTPGRYVGAAEAEEDGEPFEGKIKRLSEILEEQFFESVKLEKSIRENLKRLSYEC